MTARAARLGWRRALDTSRMVADHRAPRAPTMVPSSRRRHASLRQAWKGRPGRGRLRSRVPRAWRRRNPGQGSSWTCGHRFTSISDAVAKTIAPSCALQMAWNVLNRARAIVDSIPIVGERSSVIQACLRPVHPQSVLGDVSRDARLASGAAGCASLACRPRLRGLVGYAHSARKGRIDT